MPLFDFECTCDKHSKRSDVLLGIKHTNDDYPVCECGQKMTKLFSKATAIFKGSGFHANDYRAPTRGF